MAIISYIYLTTPFPAAQRLLVKMHIPRIKMHNHVNFHSFDTQPSLCTAIIKAGSLRKEKMMKRILAILLCCVLAAATAACTQQENAPIADASANNGDALYGRVTGIDGDRLTLALGTMDLPGGAPDAQQDVNPPEMPDGEPPQGERPSGQPGEMPSAMPSGEPAEDGGKGGGPGGAGFTENGDTLTITLSGVTVTRQNGPAEETEASGADIAADDIVKLNGAYEGNTFKATGITIVSRDMGENSGGMPASDSGSINPTDVSPSGAPDDE